MLSTYARRHQIALRSTLSTAWGFVGLAGVSAATLTTVSATVVRELGTLLTVVCGVLLALGCLAAMYGVVRDLYRIEWVSSYVASFGISPYAVSLWAVIAADHSMNYTRVTQALLVTGLLCFMLYRGLHCGAHASRLRALHIEAGEVLTDGSPDDRPDGG